MLQTIENNGCPLKSTFLRNYNIIMASTKNNSIREIAKAAEPPLAYPGAVPDSDRAKRPRLSEPPPNQEEARPGDRVEGLGNFGKPTGEVGTVEQASEEDAVVKWDDDGRMRLRQPWIKKIN
jgi:hypothetical protein